MTDTARAHHHVDWEPKRAVTLAAARRRAALGRVLRIGFWVGAAALGAAVLWFMLSPDAAPPAPEIEPAAEAGVVRMTNLHLEGRDDAGAPFQVLAETAIRRPQESANITELALPRLFDGEDVDISESGTANIAAQRGVYDSDSKVLELYVDVDVVENGYNFRTSHARYYAEENRAEGDEPVEVSGPFGTVRADRWAYEDDGKILHFEGNVRTVLNPDDEQPGQEEPAP